MGLCYNRRKSICAKEKGRMKKIAYIASECVPFIKTGGLADVVGTLPKIFDKSEYDVRIIIPNYMCIPSKFKE